MFYSLTMYLPPSLPPVSVLSLPLCHPHVAAIGYRCESTDVITESVSAGSNAAPTDAPLPSSPQIPASSAALDKWIISLMHSAFSLLSKPDVGISEELLRYNRKCQGVNFLISFFTSWVTEGESLNFFFSIIIIGILLVKDWSFSCWGQHIFKEIPSNTGKLRGEMNNGVKLFNYCYILLAPSPWSHSTEVPWILFSFQVSTSPGGIN